MDKKQQKQLELFAAQVRYETTKEIATRGFGHLPGSLSLVDVLALLYGDDSLLRVDPKNPRWEDRDLVILSKGHAGPAQYAILAMKGFFPMEELATLNQPGTNLPSHCDRNKTPGVDMTTGSLGQGVSTAIGMTLANQLAGKSARTYLFVGDGECDEGQVWEGMLFASQQKLKNLLVFVDYNKKQLDGYVKEVIGLDDLQAKFEAFGLYTQTVDGHSIPDLTQAIERALADERPACIVLDTIKGKGLPEIEAMELNHHIQIDQALAERSLAHLQAEVDRLKEELAHV